MKRLGVVLTKKEAEAFDILCERDKTFDNLRSTEKKKVVLEKSGKDTSRVEVEIRKKQKKLAKLNEKVENRFSILKNLKRKMGW